MIRFASTSVLALVLLLAGTALANGGANGSTGLEASPVFVTPDNAPDGSGYALTTNDQNPLFWNSGAIIVDSEGGAHADENSAVSEPFNDARGGTRIEPGSMTE